jgi:hypothetical protein
MGNCFGIYAWLWLALFVALIAMTPKKYRLYTANGFFLIAFTIRLLSSGEPSLLLAQSGSAIAIIIIAVNAVLWSGNEDG